MQRDYGKFVLKTIRLLALGFYEWESTRLRLVDYLLVEKLGPFVWLLIIHLGVGESGEYTSPLRGSANIHHYSPPLRWTIVN